MRKIKSNFFISLDGVVEAPDKWHFPYFDDEMGAAVGAGFATADAMLMGRVLYDEWAAYWPEHADEPFGDVMNSMKKYVVSNSLQAAEWQNSEVISGDVAQKLNEIKAQDGGDIAMSGSATTVRWLLREGLLDELNLLVHPIAVGDGLARLFPPDEPSHPPRAAALADLQVRRAEPQLRRGHGLTPLAHARTERVQADPHAQDQRVDDEVQRHDVVGVLRVHDDGLDREDHGPEDEIDGEAAGARPDEVAQWPGDEDCCDEFHAGESIVAPPASSPREGNFASSPGGTAARALPERESRLQAPAAVRLRARIEHPAERLDTLAHARETESRPEAASGEGTTAPPSRTSISSVLVRTARRTRTSEPAACFIALVSASWMTRYAPSWTSGATCTPRGAAS